MRVLRVALEDMRKRPLRVRQIAVPPVDDAERVVGAQELRVPPDRRACPPVGVVDPPRRQRLGRAVVQEHRDDRLLGDRPRARARRALRGDEIDRQQVASVPAHLRDPVAQGHVDVADDELDVAAPADRLVRGHALEPDRQVEALCERCRHDDERQAVAGARGESLRRVARHRRLVLEPEQPGGRERGDQTLPAAPGAQERGDVDAEVLPHLGAEREHVVGVDALGGRRNSRSLKRPAGAEEGGALAHAAKVRQRRATAHPFIRRLLARLCRHCGAEPPWRRIRVLDSSAAARVPAQAAQRGSSGRSRRRSIQPSAGP